MRTLEEIHKILTLDGDVSALNGDSYIRRSPELISTLKKEILHHVFLNNKEWYERFVNTDEFIHPHGIVGRIIDDGNNSLARTCWFYISCIDKDGRMFEQPYYAWNERADTSKSQEIITNNSRKELRIEKINKINED